MALSRLSRKTHIEFLPEIILNYVAKYQSQSTTTHFYGINGMKRKPVADEVRFDGAGQSDYLLCSHIHSYFSLLEKYIIYAQCHVPYIGNYIEFEYLR